MRKMTNKPNKFDDFPTEEYKKRFKEEVEKEKTKIIILTLKDIFDKDT